MTKKENEIESKFIDLTKTLNFEFKAEMTIIDKETLEKMFAPTYKIKVEYDEPNPTLEEREMDYQLEKRTWRMSKIDKENQTVDFEEVYKKNVKEYKKNEN